MADDTKMTSYARKIVVKNWFDISRLRIRTTRGVIYIQGRIYKLTGSASERDGDEHSLRKLDDDLRNIPGMKGTAYQLDNWVRESSGAWRKVGQKMTAAAKKALEQSGDIG
jgi:hypothetical protein